VSTAVIVGHPDLTASRVNAALTSAAREASLVDVRVLTVLYPDGAIDVRAEQAALEAADHVVLLYPTYWYSPPAPLKRWLDEVMARGWAYGTGRPGALAGKTLRIVTTTGGEGAAYAPGELHSFEYDDILAPMKATSHRLGMTWRAPLVVHGVRGLDDEALQELSARFTALLHEQTTVDTVSADTGLPNREPDHGRVSSFQGQVDGQVEGYSRPEGDAASTTPTLDAVV
jgi:putative NADPH-quinone reductase